jgi:hypothetical protein
MRQFFIEEPPQDLDPEVRAYLMRQMTLIQDALQSIYAIDADEIKPAKVQNGLLQYAEGGNNSQFPAEGLWLFQGGWTNLSNQSPYGTCGELPLKELSCNTVAKPSIYADGKKLMYADDEGNVSDVVNPPPYVPPEPEDIYNPDGSFPIFVADGNYNNSIYQAGGFFRGKDNVGRQHILSTYLHNGGIYVQSGDSSAMTGLHSLKDIVGNKAQRLIYNNQIASFEQTTNSILGVVPRMRGITIDIVGQIPSAPTGTIIMWNYGPGFGVRPAVNVGGGTWEALALYSDI